MAAHKNTPEKFISLIDKSGDCWIWRGTISGAGYGQFRLNGRINNAHRLSYELHVGPIPDGLLIRHSCDNPLCMNPSHLKLGTAQDNVSDRVSRKRSAWGERSPAHKLTEQDVLSIRREYIPRKNSMAKLASKYGVSDGTISHIIAGRNWANL